MSLSLITFKPDANIEKKVNFFADYFKLLNKNLGKYSYFEFETPLSLCSKVVFQIENNSEHVIGYLNHYLKHNFFIANDFTISFKYYKKLRPLIDDYLKEGEGQKKSKEIDKKNKWIINNPNFIKTLKRYIEELERSQLKVAVDLSVSYLLQEKNLESYKNKIKYLTQVIVADLRFSGKSDDSINNLINLIMSRNPKKFPLPRHISNQKNKANYEEIVRDFLENRSFRQQFNGIYNFKQKEETIGYHLFRIRNLNIANNEKINYEDVEIRNPDDPIFDNFRQHPNESRRKFWEDFVQPDKISIAITQGYLYQNKKSQKKSIGSIRLAIDFIRNVFEVNSYVDVYNVGMTTDFRDLEFSLTNHNSFYKLGKKDLKKLNEHNMFNNLINNKSKASLRFLSLEKFYRRAVISNNLSDYWHYLECLISTKGKVKEVCAYCSILCYQQFFSTNTKYDIFNFLAGNFSNIQIKSEELVYLMNSFDADYIYKRSNDFVSHPIIEELRQLNSGRDCVDCIKNEFWYFYSQFHELYETRNAHIHNGETNKYAQIKLEHTIPALVILVRFVVINELKKYKRIEMEKIIEKIVAKSRKYCPYKIEKGELVEITS